MQIEIVLIAFGVLLVAEALRSHWSLAGSIGWKRLTSRLEHYPSLTVIRPIKGLDAGAEDNIQAALDHGYPGEVETLFVFDDDSEPVLPLVGRAIAQRRGSGQDNDARVVFSGNPPAGRTGKLNAMIVALRQAKNDRIAFVDSDTRPGPDALRVLVETLENDPQAGSAFAPVVVSERPRTLGDAGYALMLNGLYGPLAAEVARRKGGKLSFIMGQFMVFKREAIDAIGGLQSAEGQLVDDMHLGESVTQAGFHNLVSPEPVPIIQYDLSFKAFMGVFVRWMTFSRTGLPGLGFKIHSWLRGAVFFLGLFLVATGAVLGSWPLAAIGGLAAASMTASIGLLHERLGGGRLRPTHWLAPGMVMLLAPFILLRIFLKREINWRGRTYKLDASARLGSSGLPSERACADCQAG